MKKIISMMLALIITAMPLFGASQVSAADDGKGILYVSLSGNDSNNGTINFPLRTVEAARNKIREMKKTGNYPNGYTVYIRGGEYNISKKISFGSSDSGTEDAPILYTNYPGEKVTFVGGQSINANDFTKVTDTNILDILADQSVRDKLYQVDLKKYGITDVGEPYLHGAYSYSGVYDFLRAPSAPAGEVFFNDTALTVARYPNEGMLSADRVIEMGWDNDTRLEGTKSSDPFTVGISDNRLTKWETSVNAQSDSSKNKVLMYGWWKYDWCDQTIPIASIDTENLNITSAWSAWLCPDLRWGTRKFYVYNLIEELDMPGEYYMDYDNCILYMYPPSDIKNAEIGLSLTDVELVSLYKTNYITFSGINITATRKYGFHVDGCNNVVIRDCEISNTASKAARIVNGTNCGIMNSYIHDVNGGVVLTGGDDVTLTPGNNFVTNCHFENFSRLSKTYNGAVDIAGVGNRVTYNKMHGSPHLAISFAGQNNEIMYNDIYNVCNERYDSGAIYGGLTWVGRGCKVMYNYIHDMETSSTGGLGISAVYMDGGQCDMTVSGNVFYNIKGGCVWLGGGQDVVIENNYFIDSKDGFWLQNPMGNVDLENSHYPRYNSLDKKVDFANNEYWKKAFPKLYTFMAQSDDEKRIPKNNTFRNNISLNTKMCKGGTSCQSEEMLPGYELVNLAFTSDPGFEDYESQNFGLDATSDVFSTLEGFYAIPFDEIGIKADVPVLKSLDAGYKYDIDFDESVMEYELMIPYYMGEIELPEIKAIAEDVSADVEVTYPDATDVKSGAGYILIELTNYAGVRNDYKIHIVPIGESIYSNGDCEKGSWQMFNVNNAVLSSTNPHEGSYCMEIDYGGFYAPDVKPEKLTPNKTYLARSSVRRSSNETGTIKVREEQKMVDSKYSITNYLPDYGEAYYWNTDGSERTQETFILSDDSWLTHYRTLVPSTDNMVADIYTNWVNWGRNAFTVDNYFLGELVVSKLGFILNGEEVPESITVSSLSDTEIPLGVKAVNQLGNSAGLGNESDYIWSLISSPTGVSIDSETGIVTVAVGTKGTVTIQAELNPSYTGAVQDTVRERITFDIVPDGFTYEADGSKVTLTYVNRTKTQEQLTYYTVFYSVDSYGTETIENLSKETFGVASGEILEVSRNIVVPNGCFVRNFLWKDNLVPVVKYGSHKN